MTDLILDSVFVNHFLLQSIDGPFSWSECVRPDESCILLCFTFFSICIQSICDTHFPLFLKKIENLPCNLALLVVPCLILIVFIDYFQVSILTLISVPKVIEVSIHVLLGFVQLLQ